MSPARTPSPSGRRAGAGVQGARPGDGQVLRLAVMDEAGCEDWVLAVLLQERHWCRRHPEVPFHTLGLAAYLDAGALAGQGYHRAEVRERNNALLALHFRPLLDLVAASLRPLLGAPARLAGTEAALPGFHIYLPHPALGGPVASVHRDLQYRDAFPAAAPGPGDVFSFTLPLCNPAGSGLSVWPGVTDPRAGAAAAPEFHPYRPGEIVVHDGLGIHQAVLCCDQGSPRISLQGHGLRVGGEFLLYW